MSKISAKRGKKKNSPQHADNTLMRLAFNNAAQANIITLADTGKIILVNKAASKLLGYSQKELLTKKRATIFDIKESRFKKMLRQRASKGNSRAFVTAIKKSGKLISCEIISSIFLDENGTKNAITSITDVSGRIKEQEEIDKGKDKIVAGNIILARSAEKKVAAKKEKVVAKNIDIALSKQKTIDIKKDKIVADNIILARSAEKKIADKKEKIVAEDIAIAISRQKTIDIKKEKIVAGNIILAKSAEKKVADKKEKVVAGNIAIAILKQKTIDIKKDRIVAGNIILAKSAEKKVADKKEKVVAKNIAIAITKQKIIDIKNDKTVADNITEAQAVSDARIVENNKWIKYIAKVSYDVMWDWDIVSGEVYIGDSLEEVFGYKLKKNSINFSDLKKTLLAEDDNRITKDLAKALASADKSWNDSYKINRHDGSVASVKSRATIIRNPEGKAIRLIGATQDVSRLQHLETKLEEQIAIKKEDTDIFHLAARLSYDAIWDWNILTNEFFLGEGFEELLGYAFKISGSGSFDWGDFLHPDDKETVEKGLKEAIASLASTWEHASRFIRADGSVANVFGRASIIRDASGKATRMIGAIHDLSQQKELEEKLEKEIASTGKMLKEYNENFRLIFNSSSDVLYDIDLETDEILLSDGYQKEFGYKIVPHMKTADVWGAHIHPEDSEAVSQDYHRMLASKETAWKYNYRLLRANGSFASIISSRIILRNAAGKAYRMIGSMQDVSKQKVLEEKLEKEIKLKEKQITEAMEDAKEAERSDIGKELHDNVNQLLGVSRLYLEMAKQGGENSKMHLSRSSEYTLTAIEEIRKLTKGLTTDNIKNFGLCESIENLMRDTMEVNAVRISSKLDMLIEGMVSDKFKLNAFRIIQEQLNNILKHASASNVNILLSQNKRSVRLVVSDDGVGFDTTQKSKGIGLENIKSRAAAYHGKAEFISRPGEGCTLTVSFDISDK